MMRRIAAAGLLWIAASGCAWIRFWDRHEGPPPDVSAGVEVVETEGVAEFYERAQTFYDQLTLRRFNTVATFQDEKLRGYFRTEQTYTDYYADLARALADAHFEKNRPLAAEVQEFVFDGPGRAHAVVDIKGDNGLPLRFWDVLLRREDRWERIDGDWWVVPGKL
jgi:hypothetical protein